jgi:outer membrane protein OmpA-like peptidoglycan-associated protein
MHKSFIIFVPLLVVACAHAPTDDLVNARRTYQQAAHGPANQLAPADVYEAKKALTRAERAHEKDPGSNMERDLAYVATRRAEIAMAQANMKEAQQKAEEAKAARIATLEEQRNRTQEQLAQAEGQLGQTELALQQARAERQQLEQRLTAATESLEGMARIEQEPDRMVMTLNGAVLFKHNSADLLPIARERLREVAAVLREYQEGNQIVIEGYTDSKGSEEYNRQLSERRATSVREFLVSEGVSDAVVTAVGRGESDPVDSNDTPEGRANNRRVEIVISKAGEGTGDRGGIGGTGGAGGMEGGSGMQQQGTGTGTGTGTEGAGGTTDTDRDKKTKGTKKGKGAGNRDDGNRDEGNRDDGNRDDGTGTGDR